MYARIAHFEGVDMSRVDEQTAEMKRQMSAAKSGELPEGAPAEARTLMEAVTRWIELIDREHGTSVGISFCKTQEDLQRAHEALNAMSPDEGGGHRTSVGLYEIVIDESFE